MDKLFKIIRPVDDLTKAEIGQLLGITVWNHFAEERYYERLKIRLVYSVVERWAYGSSSKGNFNSRNEAIKYAKANNLADIEIPVWMDIHYTGTCWKAIMIGSDYTVYPFGEKDGHETQAHSNKHVAYVAQLIKFGCVVI